MKTPKRKRDLPTTRRVPRPADVKRALARMEKAEIVYIKAKAFHQAGGCHICIRILREECRL